MISDIPAGDGKMANLFLQSTTLALRWRGFIYEEISDCMVHKSGKSSFLRAKVGVPPSVLFWPCCCEDKIYCTVHAALTSILLHAWPCSVFVTGFASGESCFCQKSQTFKGRPSRTSTSS